MGLFSKKPIQTSSHAPMYTLGNQKTVVIIGLGNPGKEYDGTRHNIGFDCLDAFVAAHTEFSGWVQKKDLRCSTASGILGSTRIIAVKPTTFMNESGQAARAVQHFFKVSNADTLVIHDELDIPFGQIRSRVGGGSAGHNGIKSLAAHLGNDFGRLRIGINSQHRVKNDEVDFVLKQFSKDEQALMPSLQKEVNALVTEYIFGDALPAETRSFIL